MMGKIVVVGVGYEEKHLTLEAIELLRSGASVRLHTQRCGCADWLRREGIPFETLDGLYEECEDFDEHARRAAEAILAAAEESDVVYGVFDVRDRSVAAILDMAGQNMRVVAGPPTEGALLAHAQGEVQLLEASDWENFTLSSARSALVRELDSRELASEVKLKLMEVYPEENEVLVRLGGGMAKTPLYNLDRLKGYDHRTCVLVPAEAELTRLERYGFDRLCEILSILCGPDGCPWDREQTHSSLRPYMIEEAYEVVGAIDEDDPYHLCDELGDMLLQVVLHAEIARQHGEFGIEDVTTAIGEKMVRRHSHIFGKDQAQSADDVTELWSRNKMAERGERTHAQSMRGVSKSLPATLRAAKVLKRLDQACKTEETAKDALQRLSAALDAMGETPSEDALGEAMLCMAAVARAAKLDLEIALNAAVDRLIARFDEIEAQARERGAWEALSDEMLKKYWNLVKLYDDSEGRQE